MLLASLTCAVGLVTTAHAQLYDGHSLAATNLGVVAAAVQPGSILVVGEVHDSEAHHENQVQILRALAARGLTLNLGMEFFEYTDQNKVDAYLDGHVGEDKFLTSIGWGSLPFDMYRRQVHFPRQHGGRTYGINLPRKITGKVSQQGLTALTPEEWALIPPEFALGNGLYRERFAAVMQGHVSPEALERYFASQSLWDDTMAFQAIQIAQAHPDSVLVILVGDFHAAFGGGLPDRIRARGFSNVTVISQSQNADDLAVDPSYGTRADYIWIAN